MNYAARMGYGIGAKKLLQLGAVINEKVVMDVTEKDILEVFSALGDDILKASQRHRHSVLYWIVKNNSIKIFKHFIEDEDYI